MGSIEEGLTVWSNLPEQMHYSKLLPMLHDLSLYRHSVYNVFHNSILTSILDKSHDIEVLREISN